MVNNAYIHIPFCKSKCKYCSFVSFDLLDLKYNYLKALKKQAESEYQKENLKTIYFGGGTPSLLTTDEFSDIISLFKIADDAEFSVEANPDSVNYEYLSALRALGVNRLSLGAQTFDDKILELIGRRHNSKQIIEAIENASKAGFKNISLDLIYGLPNQSIKDFSKDLEIAVKLGVQHISLYGLKIDEDCYFAKNPPQNIADSDKQADMYLKAIDILIQNNFEHYEISNFSKHNYESKHNMNYWDANTYYGFGCAASGYKNNTRYTNETNLKKYIQNPTQKISMTELSSQEKLEEKIFLGLRKLSGINIKNLNQEFNINFDKKYSSIIENYSDFFIKTDSNIALNTKGILLSNNILSEFID